MLSQFILSTGAAKKDRLPFLGQDGCWKCGGSVHLGCNCPSPGTRQVQSDTVGTKAEFTGSVTSDSPLVRPKKKTEWLGALPDVRQTVGKCPLCNQSHTYNCKFDWGTIEWPSSMLKSLLAL